MEQLRAIVVLLIVARQEYEAAEIFFRENSDPEAKIKLHRELAEKKVQVMILEDKVIGLTYLIEDPKGKEYVSLIASKRQFEDKLKLMTSLDPNEVNNYVIKHQLIKACEGRFISSTDVLKA